MEPETFARGERTVLRVFALVFAAALVWRLRPPAHPSTAELAVWLVLATLLISVPLFAVIYSAGFGITVDAQGVRNSSAWGVSAVPWAQIAGFAVGPGWGAHFERIYIVRTDGQRVPLRSLEQPVRRRAVLEDSIARLLRHRPAGEA